MTKKLKFKYGLTKQDFIGEDGSGVNNNFYQDYLAILQGNVFEYIIIGKEQLKIFFTRNNGEQDYWYMSDTQHQKICIETLDYKEIQLEEDLFTL